MTRIHATDPKHAGSPLLRRLRRHSRLSAAALFIGCFSLWTAQVQGVTTTWTANSAANFNWADAANWDAGVPTAADLAFFETPFPNPLFLLNPHLITLGTLSEANGLWFKDNYTLTGGDLALGAGGIRIDLGRTVTIATKLTGAGGLTVTGGGAVRLTNALNDYTGTTTISNGSVVINNSAALGTDPSTVLVTGSATRGFGGGMLVLEGNYGGGVNLTRNLSLQGLGPITDRSSALFSVQNNTISGITQTGVSPANANLVSTNIHSAGGRLTFAGELNVGGTLATTFVTFGGVNSTGVGSYAITGPLTGTGSIQKSSSGTLLLAPSDSTGFTGTIRITGGTVRVTSPTVFGANVGATTAGTIDMNGGALEILSDASFISTKNVYQRAGATFFVDHASGGTAINGTATFAALAFEENQTLTVNGRNGYGLTFAAAPVQGGDNNSTITNNLAGGGNLTFTGAFWSNTNNTANRTMTIGGNGNTLISGNVTASAAAFNHNLTKSGTGTLTITSTGSTLDGNVTIAAGTLAITDFRSITDNTSTINLGATTVAGTLNIGTATAATAGGLDTAKVINLAGTTGGGVINANQAGTNAVVLSAAFTATGTGAKTLTLGGTNTADNAVNAAIVDNGAVSLVKADAGTWVLGGNNTFTGTTTITAGTLKLRASAAASNIIASTGAVTFNANAVTQTAGGQLEFVGQAGTANLESLGALTATAGMGTIKLTPGASGGTASLTFISLAAPAQTAGINIIKPVGANNVTLTGQATSTATTLPGTGKIYINGADFARIGAAALVVTPVYGTDAGFVNAGAALTATSHNRMAAGIVAQPLVTVSSLKIDGGHTLDLAGILTISTGGLLQTGGTGTVQGASGVTTGGTNALSVRVNLGTDILNLSAPINATSTGGLTKNGAGILVLSGANAQTGVTTINEGTIRLSGAGVLSANSQDLTIRQGGALDLNGVGTGDTIKNLVGSGIVTNSNATAATLTVGNGSPAASTFSGVIQNGAGITNVLKRGTANFTFSGASTYTGTTTIESTGALIVSTLTDIGTASGIGRGNNTSDATNAASLVFSGPGAAPTPTLTYAGTTSVSTNRLFTLDMATAGSIALIQNNSGNNSALIFSKTTPIAFGVNATTSQTLAFGGSSTADSVFNPQITDNGILPTNVGKTGAGIWMLGNAANSYTGVTAINEGVLIAKDGTTLPNASGLWLGAAATSGVLLTSGNFTRNVATVPGANTVTWNGTTGGGGFAASDAKLVVALGGLATPTALTWDTGGFVGTGGTQNLILNSATALNEIEWRNPIDIGAAVRTIQVDDNTNTQTDFATITGVISGGAGGGISKTGAGTLQLLAANTHTGSTAVTAGLLVVNSLGLSTDPAAGTSVGFNTGANTAAQAVTLGNGTTGIGVLQYVGQGETSDRMIRLNTSTGNNQIHADGSGALVLTNVVNDMTAGAKVLVLRGSNTAGNRVDSILVDNGGALGVTVDGSATWILTAANTITGTISANAGALGIGHNSALGTGTLSLSNSSIFAYGADRTVTNAITHVNNTTQAFIGDYSLNFTGTYTNAAAANNIVLTNTIVTGKTLTLASIPNTAITAARTITFNGSGDTIVTGDITTLTAFALNVTYSGTGSLRLNGAANLWNGGALTVSSGKFILGGDEVIPHFGAAAVNTGNVVINPAAGVTATFDLNGRTETINGLTGTTAGTMIIDNSSASSASLTVGDNNQAVNFNGSITRSGGGNLTLNKIGTGVATFSGPANLTTINVQEGSLKLNGGITAPTLITSLTVAGGALFQTFDNVGTPLPNLATLNLGTGAGITTLELDAGTTSDTLTTSAPAIVANTVNFSIRDAGLTASGTYPLLVAPSGLSGGTYTLGPIGGYTGSTLTVSDTLVRLNLGTAVTGNMFWTGTGATPLAWNSVDGSSNGDNWSSDKPGTTVSTTVPGAGTTVVFQANNALSATPGQPLATTLEQSFRINNLLVETATNPQPSISIAPGAVTANRLTIQPALSTDGIDIQTGTAQGVVISAPFAAGAAQTWNVADLTTVPLTGGVTVNGNPSVTVASTTGLQPGMQIAGPGIPTGAFILSVNTPTTFTMSANATGANAALQSYNATSALSFTGGLFGSGNITKTGNGRVVLSGAGNTYTGTAVNVAGGVLETQNVTALGGVAATPNTGATLTVSTGGLFRHNSATGGTIANPLVLNGGTLAIGGFTSNATTLALTIVNHTFSGTVNMAANSTVHLAELGTHPTLTHTVTMPGVFSGAGALSINSVATVSGGNQLNGLLQMNGNNAGWSGGLNMLRGTVATTNANGFGTGPINITSFGRVNFQGTNGTTWNLPNNITYADGAIGELGVDNVSGPVTAPFTANFNGTVALGAASGMRVFISDGVNSPANFTGNFTLTGDASFSVGGTAAVSIATISGIIGESGGARALSVNDDLGGWGTTNRTVRLTAPNTFTGALNLGEGVLEFITVSNVGGPASNLGQGPSMGLGTGTLSFVGGASQSTDRPITLTGSPTLLAAGTGGATITYAGAITGAGNSLILDGASNGTLSGALTQTGTTADLTKNGLGTWDITATNTIADDILANAGILNINATQAITDDIVVTGLTAVVNLNAINSHQGDDLFIRAGATVNLGINGALAVTGGMDDLVIADTASVDVPKLDLKGFTSTVDAVTIGLDNTAVGQIVDTIGGGVLTAASYTVRHGDASAILGGAAATMAKNGAGTFTLTGNNTFGGATTVTEGNLILDYTTNNTSKISATAGITLGGGVNDANPTLTLNGNAGAPTVQNATTLTVSQGSNNLVVNSNGGQPMTLNLTTIARNAGGTVDFTLPAAGSITTTQPLTNGLIGGYATVNNGAAFASKDGSNNIIPVVAAVKDDVLTWLPTDNVTDSTGYINTLVNCALVNSITFTAAGSTVSNSGLLGVNSGGILVTSAATGAGITGGNLGAANGDIMVHQYAGTDFTIASSIRGANAITKTGPGSLLLSGVNTSSGAVNITEGLIKVTGGQALGDTAPISFKDIAGSGLQLLANETVGGIIGGNTVGGNIAIGSNTLTLNTTAAATFNGQITGNGVLIKQGTANQELTTSSHTTFNGSVVVNQGLLFLSGNGIANLPAISSITSSQGGSLLIDFNSGTTGSSRINDAAVFNLSSQGNGTFAGLQIRSNQDASHTETIGALNLLGSSSLVGVAQAGGTDRTLNLTSASLNRFNNATVFLAGRNLAITTGNNRGRIIFTAAPAVVGGAGVAGAVTPATNVPIIRYAVTQANTAAFAVTDIPNTFANYNTTTGVTPLLIATEYRLDSAGYTASADVLDNLRFTGTAAALATKEFNAIVFDSSTAAMTVSGAGGGGNVLTVGSGAMLFTSTVLANGTTLDTFDGITPGVNSGNEFIITTANTTATINSVLTDVVGPIATTLTKSGSGTLILGGTNTFTGPVVFNQGIVRATALGNLGGGTELNFFGGTLQFGGVFDPSVRTITFNSLGGGGTFDTNGNNISLASAIGNTGLGSFTKTGAGNLTVNAAVTHTGGTVVTGGTLTTGLADALGAGANITVNGATAVLDLGAFNHSPGVFSVIDGTVNGTGTLTPTSLQLQGGSISSTVILAGAIGFTKTGAGTLTMPGTATFTGRSLIENGTVNVDVLGNVGIGASGLGAPVTVDLATIHLGAGATSGTVNYTGAGTSTDRKFALVGGTGGGGISNSGTGALIVTGSIESLEFGAKTFTLGGSANAAIINELDGAITECMGSVSLAKIGASTWRLDAVNLITGPNLSVDDGKLILGVANSIPSGTMALRMGNGTTAGTFDTNGFNTTFTGLTSLSNTASANNMIVNTGTTMTINGGVTIGVNTAAATTTALNATGGGTLTVNSGGANIQIGGATGATNSNTVTVDLSGLTNFTANLGAGTYRQGDANTGTSADPTTVKLAVNNTITAAAIRVGDGSGPGSTHTLTLGSGTNELNTDTLNIGTAAAGIRSSGVLNFDAGDTTGSLTVRGAAGGATPVANFNMTNSTGGTAGNMDSTVNLAGHTANIIATNMVMASRTQNTGGTTATFTFDQGTLAVATLNMASRTGAGTGDATAIMNLGDSAAPGSPTTTIGPLTMAVNTSAGGTVTADLNVTGGTVNIGPINMANAATGQTVTSTIDLTGGTLSVTGNIVRTGGAGTENATLTVNGGSLNLNSNSIGTGLAPVTLVAASGIIRDLVELNGGGAFSKTTVGVLTLEGTNTHTGDTTVTAGTLVVNNSAGSGTGSGAVTVDASTFLAGNGSIAPAAGKNILLNGETIVGIPASTLAEDLAMTITGASTLTFNNTVRFDIFANANTGTLNLATANDLLDVNAPDWTNLVFGTGSILKVETALPTGAWAQGDAWKIFDWAGIVGTAPSVGSGGFATLDLPALTGGQTWNTSLLYTSGVISIDAVPEPSRALLLLLGFFGLLARRRRK